ncbi:MAG: TlpA family protein disulfide reductase [Clostridia bacterium]|nr:TlpA family protein disulfide reductase [Clostridia bacterium]
MTPDTPVEGTAVGNLCPDITLDVLNKDTDFTLSANRGKVTVLNFWYTTCGPCVEELPHFNALANADSDVTVAAVHIEFPGMTSADALSWAQSNNPDWVSGNMLLAWDTDMVCQTMFNIQACPVTVVIDAKGVISDIFVGSVTESELLSAVAAAKGH